jgi:glycosyltransferase involved in cell wall biosynthesis
VADLAGRLAAAGHSVDVITTTPADASPDAPAGVRVVRLPAARVPRTNVALLPPALVRALDAALVAGAYDVVHCHSSLYSPAALVATWVARRRGVATVFTIHSIMRLAAPVYGLLYRAFRFGRSPIAVTGVSTFVATYATPLAPQRSLAVLPDGTDVAWWSACVAPPTNGDAWGERAPGGELRIVCAMRLTHKKRPDALIRLVAKVRRAAPGRRVRLALAGDGYMRDEIARLVRRLGLEDDVRLLGWRSRADLRALYRDADCFVLPTRREAFGIAALEARAAGLPVVAFRDSGVADFVREGRHGQLCASDADMVACVAGFAIDPSGLAVLAERCRAEPPRLFDWNVVLASHLALYNAQIAETASGPVA